MDSGCPDTPGCGVVRSESRSPRPADRNSSAYRIPLAVLPTGSVKWPPLLIRNASVLLRGGETRIPRAALHVSEGEAYRLRPLRDAVLKREPDETEVPQRAGSRHDAGEAVRPVRDVDREQPGEGASREHAALRPGGEPLHDPRHDPARQLLQVRVSSALRGRLPRRSGGSATASYRPSSPPR